MSRRFEIKDLHRQTARKALLRVNNHNAKETSLLTPARFDTLVSWARVALFVHPSAALLLAFDQSAAYDGENFLWFRERFERFLYIDRVVVSEKYRRCGIGRLLYAEVSRQATMLGYARIVCEVNVQPPNPVSDHFHATVGFREVGRAPVANGEKTVRYLAADLPLSIVDVIS
jgi:predicted GNAT superfamily acetyltransferase